MCADLLIWDEDLRFQAVLSEVQEHTILDVPRCYILWQLGKTVSAITGDAAELGVYRGGTAKLLAKACPGRTLHLFDPFTGLPAPSLIDVMGEGEFIDTSLEQVEDYLRDCRDVRIYPGLFPETARPTKDAQFCFVHVDADLYRSVLDACIWSYPRLRPGGVMVFDDHGWSCSPGAKQAVDEFFADRPEYPVYLPTGQAVVIRHHAATDSTGSPRGWWRRRRR
ncbi:MAG TPA: TylF/MycF/NovP-related O-methyltransferase [Armatimonadota bacterium]|nr:TylF/MycF/NovP-related O-methyltransferase [Armatimonadota bacterium]